MIRPRRTLPVLALAALLLPTVLVAAPAQAGVVTVTGRAIGPDGDPVAGVLVTAASTEELWTGTSPVPDPERETITRDDGTFTVRAPSKGAYAIRLCAADTADDRNRCLAPAEDPAWQRTYVGSSGQAAGWVALPRLLDATTGSRDLGSVHLQRPGRVEGRLVHANAQPAGSGRAPELVVLRRLDGTQADYRYLTSEHYSFTGLAPGQYRVESHLEQLRPARHLSPVLTVRSGTTVRSDATLARPVQVTGRVTAAGRAVARQQLVLLRGRTEVGRTLADADGRYRFVADGAGRYAVRTAGRDSAFRTERSRTVSVGEGGRARLDLRLVKGGVIRLAVPRPSRSGVLHQLRDAEGRLVAVDRVASSAFRFRGLAPGRYVLTTVSGQRYARRAVDLRGRRTIDLGRVRPDRRTVSWTGRTGAGAVIELVDRRDLHDPDAPSVVPESPVADASGRFRAVGLVPGTYAAVVRPTGGSSLAPAVVSRLRVTTDLRRDVPLQTGAVVTGRLVRDVDGSALEVPLAVEAQHLGENRRYQAPFAVSDEAGGFAIRGLMAGRLDVTTNVGEGVDRAYWEVGTPYFFRHDPIRLTTAGSGRTVLGDVRLSVGGQDPL